MSKFKSNAKVIALVIIALVVGWGIGYATTPALITPTTPTTVQVTYYPYGIVAGLTGNMMSVGQDVKTFALLAINDFNAYLNRTGQPYQIVPYVEDGKGTPEGSLSAFQAIVEGHGAKAVEVANTFGVLAVKPYSDAHHIIVTSGTSTGVSAAIPNDYIFRFSGPDAANMRALVGIVEAGGAKSVLLIAQDDDAGHSREALLAQLFAATGISFTHIFYGVGEADYASEVAEMSRTVQSNNIDAVLAVGYESDGVNIIGHAAQDPVLSSVHWYTYDVWSEAVFYPPLAPASVAEWMMKVHVIGTNFPIPQNSYAKDVVARFEASVGRRPSAQPIEVYDGVYIGCMAMVMSGNDPDKMKLLIPEISAHYYGVSGGPLVLDENGDLKYQDYVLWSVTKTGDTYAPQQVGYYTSFTNTLTWNANYTGNSNKTVSSMSASVSALNQMALTNTLHPSQTASAVWNANTILIKSSRRMRQS